MLDVAHLFPLAGESVYLNTASLALGNDAAANALAAAVDRWQRGAFDWVEAERVGEEARQRLARLIGAGAADVALVSGAAGGAATVAAQLPEGGPGANVVVPARDFASNFVAWALLAERGYQLRLVEDVAGALPLDAFAELADRDTAVIATSAVQSASGFRVDLDGLRELAAGCGAWLVVDASQAAGAEDINMAGLAALFSCSHKWLLGIRGIGYLAVDPELHDRFRPIAPGWKALDRPLEHFYGPEAKLSATASRLDVSTPWFDPIANVEGLRIIEEVGVASIQQHNRMLLDVLVEGGVEIPYARSRQSAIVSVPVQDRDRTLAALAADGVIVSVRAGRLRVSVHLYNTVAHMERLLAALGTHG